LEVSRSVVFDDFTGPVLEVAERILAKRLVTRIAGVTTSVLICEVEAYGGADYPASHASGGPKRRNRTMFSQAGTLYVYRSYGVHWCANVVTGPEGEGQAVLLRGGMPEWGSETMVARRGREDHLCDGPGKLTRALGVDGSHDGLALSEGRKVWLEESDEGPPESIRTPRVGISRATERPWRFVAVGMGYRSPRGPKPRVL